MGGKGGKLVSLLILFTAAVWCVPFSGAVGLFNKLQTQKQTAKRRHGISCLSCVYDNVARWWLAV